MFAGRICSRLKNVVASSFAEVESGNSNGGGGGSLPSRREVVEARRGARKRVQLSRRSPFICAAAVSRGIRETSQV